MFPALGSDRVMAVLLQAWSECMAGKQGERLQREAPRLEEAKK